MSTLLSNGTGAVATRLHDVVIRGERSGVVGARGRVRGTVGRHGLTAQPSTAASASVAPPAAAPVQRVSSEPVRGDRAGRPAAQGGLSEAEFTAYVRERRAALYATAYHLTGDRFEAEDLLQSALFSTYRAWDRISDKAAVGGYLRRTMTNLHISAWRRRKLNEYPTEELPETAGDLDSMRGTELRTVLWQALARLPEPQRTMLVLRYYEGRTDPEIADILNISVGTVKSSIWRSLRRLREDQVLGLGRDEEEAFGELVA
ncbi:SigE family RNA polymerase sigma factor [Streptomyces sp. NPDC002644]